MSKHYNNFSATLLFLQEKGMLVTIEPSFHTDKCTSMLSYRTSLYIFGRNKSVSVWVLQRKNEMAMITMKEHHQKRVAFTKLRNLIAVLVMKTDEYENFSPRD